MVPSVALQAEAPRVVARCMTRCECAGLAFDELRRRMHVEGLSAQDACRRTGCGQLCTACLPDLEAFLARER